MVLVYYQYYMLPRSRKILITGIGGYICSNIAVRLMNRHRLVGVGRGEKFPVLKEIFGERVELREADIADRETLQKYSKGAEIIIHGVSPQTERFCQEHPKEARRVIVEGTKVIADIAEKQGAFLVHLSTLAVYSTHRERPMPLKEDSELMPDTNYGLFKAEAEKEAARVSSLILRLSNVFGAGEGIEPHEHTVTTIFVSRAVMGEPLVVYGDGQEQFDFIHLKDVTRVCEEIVNSSFSFPPVLNVSSGQPVSLGRLADVVNEESSKLFGKKVPREHQAPPPERQPRPTRWLSNARIREIFPWFPSVVLEEGIREMLLYYHNLVPRRA